MLKKIWNGFVDRFIKSGFWLPVLLVVTAGVVWYIWGSLVVAYFVFAVFALFIIFIGLRQLYWLIFKKGDYDK